ncbi:MAG TPA: hypothetical protein VGA73_07715 [Candidatus Binatia bacterium]
MRIVMACGALAPLLVAAVGHAGEPPKPRDDVAQMIIMMDGLRDRNCAERKVDKTELLETAPDKRPAVERWTIDRCGKPVNYRVKYSKGGADFDVQLEK